MHYEFREKTSKSAHVNATMHFSSTIHDLFSKIRNIYFTLRRCNIELDVDSKRACANAYGKYIGVV